MTSNLPTTSSPTFTHEDRTIARIAREIYMREINGAGLRWQFGHGPNEAKGMYWVHRHVAEHYAHLDAFKARVARIGDLVNALNRFVGQSISLKGLDRAVVYSITEEDVQTYRRFYNALTALAEALAEFSLISPEVEHALRQVCSVADPDGWRGELLVEVPDNAKWLTDTSMRYFFEAVIRPFDD